MFIIYAIFYAGFVVINLAAPLAMEAIVLFGWNLATVYGFGLIIGAVILAVIYDQMCKKHEDMMAAQKKEKES